MNRRGFLKTCGIGIVQGGSSFTVQALANYAIQEKTSTNPEKAADASSVSVSKWMSAWMLDENRGAGGRLVLSRFVEPIYYLEKSISWIPNDKSGRYPTFTVPKGFVTDLASVPSIFWSVLRPDGNYAYAAILHDYLYWTQMMSKVDADNILRISMQDFHVPAWKINAIYQGVHLAGKSSWTENQRLKANGESRFLAQFPSDPMTTWQDWKSVPSHFVPM